MGVLITELKFTDTQAGSIVTAELLASFFATILLAPFLARQSKRRWAIAGVIVVAVGQASSVFFDQYAPLRLTRCISGTGAGLLLAAVAATIAGTDKPERTFAIVTALTGLILGLLVVSLSSIMADNGRTSLFALLSTFCLACVVPIYFLSDDATAHTEQNVEKLGNYLPAALLLSGVFLFAAASQGVWAFSERIGLNIGMTQQAVGLILGVSIIGGVIGSGLAGIMATRYGRLLPVFLGTGVATVSMFVLPVTASAWVYSVAQIIWGIAFFFTLPYLLGIGALLDIHGRWAAISFGTYTLGSALGPSGVGIIFGNSWLLSLAVGGVGILSFLVVAGALRTLRQDSG